VGVGRSAWGVCLAVDSASGKLGEIQVTKDVPKGVISSSSNRRGYKMPPASEYLQPPSSYQQEILHEMYESSELVNEGLASFEYPLYFASDKELDYFLGNVISSVGKAIGSVAKTAGKALSAVDKVVPMSVLTSGLAMTPMGMASRAGLGALQAAGEGRNVFQGAVRSLATDPVTRFYVDTGMAAARGENVLQALQKSAQAQIGDLRKSLQFAAMVAPFIPGIGTGVAAALAAGNALAAGQPITDALIAAAKNAVPGGAVAQLAFQTAIDLAKGKKIGDALLDAARSRLPGGPAAQAAFDAAVALAKGRNIQDAAFAAAGRLLPPSPYAADALSFAQKVASGQNIQKAALSTIGNRVMNKIEQQAGPLLSRLRAPLPRVPSRLPRVPIAQAAFKTATAARRAGLPGIASRLAGRIPQPLQRFPALRPRIPMVPSRGPAAQAAVAMPRQAAAVARAQRPRQIALRGLPPGLPQTPPPPLARPGAWAQGPGTRLTQLPLSGTWERGDGHVIVLDAYPGFLHGESDGRTA
jgi:hypothetical protein